jgi:D-arabinose 1-dehydrogenase-like Zn-dependent alcohol dehydrogenase
MIQVSGYGALNATSSIAPIEFERRELGEKDILIDILYCGVCHSDIHMARSEWGPSVYPIVPGHEIVGKISQIGPGVTQFKVFLSIRVGNVLHAKKAKSSIAMKGLRLPTMDIIGMELRQLLEVIQNNMS